MVFFKKGIEGIILDLDGVITSTTDLHIRAWKEMFDSFLADFSQRTGISFTPLDPNLDYRAYIDGCPRYEGVAAFLQSRNITLPFGAPEDDPEVETICALGNRKNNIYRSLLQKIGANVYEDALDAIRFWRVNGKKIAVVSASKNCREVLSLAGITGLFDVIVDGNDASSKNLMGKPSPDTFLFAAREMNTPPSRAVVIEDAHAGVRAGKAGNFAYVVGVTRNGSEEQLHRSGADIVISSLKQIMYDESTALRSPDEIPSALDSIHLITKHLSRKHPLVLLDYDGTLTPIVSDPDKAILSDRMRSLLKALSRHVTVAIVSGRDLTNIKNLVQLNELIYAGSHGFEIEAPDGAKMELKSAREKLEDLEKAEQCIRSQLQSVPGILFERKRYAFAIHYRNVSEVETEEVRKTLVQISGSFSSLKLTSGKKVFEFRPGVNWDKGMAVNWIIERICGNKHESVPVYIGDDITDEDAFRAIKGTGTGILVGNHGSKSYADYSLEDTEQVYLFLNNYLESSIHAP